MAYLFAFLLINLLKPEGIFGGAFFWDLLTLGLLIAGCLQYLPMRYSKFYYTPIQHARGFLLFGFFNLLIIICLWRTHSFLTTDLAIVKRSMMIILLPLFVYFLYQYKSQKEGFSGEQFVLVAIHAIGIFCLVNLLSFLIMPAYSQGYATTFGLLGLDVKKIVFPLYPDTHPNSIGSAGGYLFVFSVGFILFVKSLKGRLKMMMIGYAVLGMILVLMGDSRGTLFSTIFTVLIIYFLYSIKNLKVLKYSIYLLPVSHVLFIAILAFAADSSLMNGISRNDGSDIASGNSRKFIYMAANMELADFKPIHVVGFGEYGIYGAGLTKYYMQKHFLTKDKTETLLASVAHNSALQAIFDVGYIGLLVYMMLLFSLFTQALKLFENGHEYLILALCFFVNVLLTGISESKFGAYSPFLSYMFLTFATIILFAYNSSLYKEKKKKIELCLT